MSKSLYLAYVAVLTFFAACGSINQGESQPSPVHELKGTPWGLQESMGQVFSVFAENDYVVVRNNMTDTKLMLVNRKDHSDVHYFGLFGEGPSMLVNPGSVIMEKDHVEVYDGAKTAFLQFPYDSIRIDNPHATGSQILGHGHGLISIGKLSGGFYVGSGLFEKGRLCLMDPEGKVISYTGSYPQSGQLGEIPFHVLGVAYQSAICVHPNGDRMALATRYGGIIEIYDWDEKGKNLSEVIQTDGFHPEFRTEEMGGTPNFRPSSKTRWGYISVDCTENYIFGLYSGKLQTEDNSFRLGREVHVYDWAGNSVCQLRLDHDALYMAVCDNMLYILEEDEEGNNDIVEYKIEM